MTASGVARPPCGGEIRSGPETGSLSISFRNLLDSNVLARGLAIWTVVACHIPFAHPFWKPLWLFASAGKLAVSLFLFSSGLLLQFQVNRAGGVLHVGTWLKKRFFRVYPVYWAGLLLTIASAWLIRHKVYDPGTILANVLGIPLLIGKKAVSAGYAVPFWFISILLLCYLLFIGVHRIRPKAILVLTALGLSFAVLRTGIITEAAALSFPAFFMGMAMADWLERKADTGCDVRIQILFFMPLLVLLAAVFKGPRFFHLDVRYSVWLVMTGCVGLTLVSGPILYVIAYVQKTLASAAPGMLRFLLWVSGLTFAVYCIHEPLLVILATCTQAGHPWVGLLLYAGVTVAGAWLLDALDRRIRGT